VYHGVHEGEVGPVGKLREPVAADRSVESDVGFVDKKRVVFVQGRNEEPQDLPRGGLDASLDGGGEGECEVKVSDSAGGLRACFSAVASACFVAFQPGDFLPLSKRRMYKSTWAAYSLSVALFQVDRKAGRLRRVGIKSGRPGLAAMWVIWVWVSMISCRTGSSKWGTRMP
jgi:hypothetical protein